MQINSVSWLTLIFNFFAVSFVNTSRVPFTNPLHALKQGRGPIYCHRPHELCIIAGGPQKQLILSYKFYLYLTMKKSDFSWHTILSTCLSSSFVLTRCCTITWVTKILMQTISNVHVPHPCFKATIVNTNLIFFVDKSRKILQTTNASSTMTMNTWKSTKQKTITMMLTSWLLPQKATRERTYPACLFR